MKVLPPLNILPPLKIGSLTANWPIIQGGMAIRISTAPLAAAVAEEGGIGVIAGTAMSIEELKAEIRKARELTKGIIGINVMFAATEFANLIKTAIAEKIDLLIAGAGFSRDIFSWGKEAGIPVVPIVSSAKLARLSEKLGASAVIVEAKEAGGHLGTLEPLKKILPEVREAVDIPVIAAGGIMDGAGILEALKMGANGVQMGTIFAASKESNASEEFKKLYIKSEHKDVVLIDSPAGLPGRALLNEFSEKVLAYIAPKPEVCDNCLKHCNRTFCVKNALIRAQQGNIKDGLVFTGEYVEKIKEILPVKEIFARLKREVKALVEVEVQQ